jgi:hypothetical protein
MTGERGGSMTSGTDSGAAEQAEVAEACAQLQDELDSLIGGLDSEAAVQSLDTAIGSLKDVEHQNVSTVQLVALTDA